MVSDTVNIHHHEFKHFSGLYIFGRRWKGWEMYNLEKCSIMAEQMLTVTQKKIFIFFSFLSWLYEQEGV